MKKKKKKCFFEYLSRLICFTVSLFLLNKIIKLVSTLIEIKNITSEFSDLGKDFANTKIGANKDFKFIIDEHNLSLKHRDGRTYTVEDYADEFLKLLAFTNKSTYIFEKYDNKFKFYGEKIEEIIERAKGAEKNINDLYIVDVNLLNHMIKVVKKAENDRSMIKKQLEGEMKQFINSLGESTKLNVYYCIQNDAIYENTYLFCERRDTGDNIRAIQKSFANISHVNEHYLKAHSTKRRRFSPTPMKV